MLPADEESDPQIEASKNLLQRTQESFQDCSKRKLLEKAKSCAVHLLIIPIRENNTTAYT